MSNTRSKSIKYISKHYDLGNEFFAKWLDKTLTYSSAIYENKNDDLSYSLKKNLQLRKKQISERDNKNIIGKRTNKIGLSRLSLDTSNK